MRSATQTTASAPTTVSARTRLATAFRTLGNGVEPSTAYQRTKQWFCAAGADWSHALSATRGSTGDAANDAVYDTQAAIPAILQTPSEANQRATLVSSFRALGLYVDPSIAYQRTRRWYCPAA